MKIESSYSRREFIRAAAASATLALSSVACSHRELQTDGVIDVHTHFYDPKRPKGVPWPPENDRVLYRPILPAEYEAQARPLGIVGTVVIEASAWVEDNDWLLDLAKREPIIRGVVGFLKPGKSDFKANVARYASHDLFKGARLGGWDTLFEMPESDFGKDLRWMAERELAVDVNVDVEKLETVIAVARFYPNLRLILNHCAGVRFDGGAPTQTWVQWVRRCTPFKNLYMKVSGLVEQTVTPNGNIPTDVGFYRPALDVIWNAFGEDRVLFGSNWPVSSRFAPLSSVYRLATEDARSRGRTAFTKFVRANALKAYRLSAV